jgi:hypothetical protein
MAATVERFLADAMPLGGASGFMRGLFIGLDTFTLASGIDQASGISAGFRLGEEADRANSIWNSGKQEVWMWTG